MTHHSTASHSPQVCRETLRQWATQLRLWSLYTMVRTYIGLQVGYLKKSGVSSITKLVAMPKAQSADGAPGGSTGKSGEAVSAARAKCGNTQHLACMLGQDLRLKRFVTMIAHCLAPLRLEHGLQNKMNRSPSASFDYYLGLSTGSWAQPLQQMVASLSEAGFLESIGLAAVGPEGESFGLGSAPSVEQDEMVSLLVSLVCNTVAARSNSQLW